MKRCILVSLCCLAAALCLPLLSLRLREAERPEESGGTETAATALPAPSAAPGACAASDIPRDEECVLTVLTPLGTLEETTMARYLPGVLAGEMPASFETEALRAQAVAARSYILSRAAARSAAHPEADVCADPGCCLAWRSPEEQRERWGADYETYAARIAGAAADTDGVVLTWESRPILACFHSSSAGKTESSAAVWNGALPYLVSVSSPETGSDVPNYVTSSSVSPEAFRATLLSRHPELSLEGDPGCWLGEPVPDESGRVAYITVGGAEITGAEMRSLFSLRSAAFTLLWTGEDFRFTVTGSGHGVGMSQYGANVMAANGSTWQEILAHYYPGAELSYPSYPENG